MVDAAGEEFMLCGELKFMYLLGGQKFICGLKLVWKKEKKE